MSGLGSEDQWRSFQTYIAAYVAGMLHPRDVFAETSDYRNSHLYTAPHKALTRA